MPLADAQKLLASGEPSVFFSHALVSELGSDWKLRQYGTASYVVKVPETSEAHTAVSTYSKNYEPPRSFLAMSAATMYEHQVKKTAGINWVPVTPHTLTSLSHQKPNPTLISAPDPDANPDGPATSLTWNASDPGIGSILPCTLEEARELFLGLKPVSVVSLAERVFRNEDGDFVRAKFDSAYHNTLDDAPRTEFIRLDAGAKYTADIQEDLRDLSEDFRSNDEKLTLGRRWIQLPRQDFMKLAEDEECKRRQLTGH